MLVKELREALEDMPGEMPVYNVAGHGVLSAKHIFRGDLVSVTQFCELLIFTEGNHQHTPQFQDSKIERNTGFKDRDELIAAYLKMKRDKTICPFHQGTVTDATKCICD